ncbi:Crp family transcriptional regulator protein (plasmid) [Rhizobium etli 8C-3]|uniref:CRP-like cAMP-binding protein n=2 Tax=Rhizobium TaxID=379 RepID=A0A4R3RXY2_9HYPH|nr:MULTISPECIES: Crp/Fnr family transcriptional regulator [Rhizobium]APO77775.1 Crp family transcriptional regulator protein [Rhizobium etli 8C-3]TCU30742.1 CRP-like cAMP-binding protein [Rhizobium azibense]TCU41250.1 CRP-like cAMP-binding protein [Rhizobium azibense]
MFNRILNLLEDSDRERLLKYLEPVALPRLAVLSEPDQPQEFSYFPESGIGSIMAVSPSGETVEVGIFGREGMSPPNSLFEDDRAPFKVFMQVEGNGHKIRNEHLFAALVSSRTMRKLLSRYAQTLFVQTAYTALTNATHHVDERLARSLLMVHDRTAGDRLSVTHDFLAGLLNVRRPSVTTALHVLEGHRFIVAERGQVTIRNREALQAFAGDAYGIAEREFTRLIGSMR